MHDMAADPSDVRPEDGQLPGQSDQVAQFRAALANRDRIGQAKGIIRLLTRVNSDAAFEILRRLSQETNRRVSDIATEIADCAGTGRPLSPELAAQWHWLTGSNSSLSHTPIGEAETG